MHFTYTHFSGSRGVAFYLHTLSGQFLNEINKNDLTFKNFRAARALFLKKSKRKMGYNILKYFRAARAINNTIHKKSQLDIASPLGGDVEEIGHFQKGKYVHIVPFFGITSWGRC